jgi:hypothetical protein
MEFDEQTAIAQVHSDIDTNITALESRLTKARALKQAMAQALLTGMGFTELSIFILNKIKYPSSR